MEDTELYFLTAELIEEYRCWLVQEEKSRNTIEKYMRDIHLFYLYLPKDKRVDKTRMMAWKNRLAGQYAVRSVNSMLAALNGFFHYMAWNECRVKLLKCQRRMFCEEEKELSRSDYLQLIAAAKQRGNRRLSLLIETICATGIRVSELQYITVEAVRMGRADIDCKGKRRTIFLPGKLCSQLKKYAGTKEIATGHIFRTRSGKPLDRSNIWKDMKALCESAGVEPSKVFPHNLRHLFARTFYSMDKDIARLADILGHSSIETTRIYTISSGNEHAKKIARLGLVV